MVSLIRSKTYPTDPKDAWGKETTIGLAEHAVRLHAPPLPFDRQGAVLDWESFESASEKHYSTISGAGGTVNRSTDNPMFGDFCLELVTGATSGNSVRVTYENDDFHIGKIGAQLSFATQATSASAYISMIYYNGTNKYTATLKYTMSDDKLQYLDSAGAQQDISTIPYYKGAAGKRVPYTTIKLVADFVNNTYIRSLFVGEENDLSAHTLKSDASLLDPYLETRFSLYTNANVAYTAYIDNFVLTENEPDNP